MKTQTDDERNEIVQAQSAIFSTLTPAQKKWYHRQYEIEVTKLDKKYGFGQNRTPASYRLKASIAAYIQDTDEITDRLLAAAAKI